MGLLIYTTQSTDATEMTDVDCVVDAKEQQFLVKDSVIVEFDNKYAMIHNNNSRMMLDLHVAFSDKLLGPWSCSTGPFTGKFSERPAVLKLGDELIVYFGVDKNEQYGAAKTSDFITWTDITSSVSLPEGYQYGTIFEASRAILENIKRR